MVVVEVVVWRGGVEWGMAGRRVVESAGGERSIGEEYILPYTYSKQIVMWYCRTVNINSKYYSE